MEKNFLDRNIELLLIGGSAGSLEVIFSFIPYLKTNLPFAIVLVLHRRYSYDTGLVSLMGRKTSLEVHEAEEKASIHPGIIYLAPADYHLLIEKDRSFSLDDSEKVNHSRPSIDVTFESAADVYGQSLACILLSGANSDGVDGVNKIKQKGGLTVAQDPSTAAIAFMPQQAIDMGCVDLVIDQSRFINFINQLGEGPAPVNLSS